MTSPFRSLPAPKPRAIPGIAYATALCPPQQAQRTPAPPRLRLPGRSLLLPARSGLRQPPARRRPPGLARPLRTLPRLAPQPFLPSVRATSPRSRPPPGPPRHGSPRPLRRSLPAGRATHRRQPTLPLQGQPHVHHPEAALVRLAAVPQ